MYLTNKQIEDYKNLGVIIIKDVFKDWIEPLRLGFQKVLNNPSKHGRENVTDKRGRFFEDYCNWQRISEFKDCIFNSKAAQIVAEATSSKSSQIFHEHIFIKEAGTHKETPWHQDMPYFCTDGNKTGSFWIPLDNVDKENTLQQCTSHIDLESISDKSRIALFVKHSRKIDVWYDCQGCCDDASTWSDLNGFTQCVSSYITRAGTDNGKWVKLNSERWQWVTHICLCQKCPIYYEDYPDEWAKFSNNECKGCSN